MAVILDLQPRAVPLTRLDNGVYRVTGCRIPLERIVEHYQAGATPEQIVEAYDTLRLADVYTLIGYYLDHKEEVEAYLREQDEEAEALRREIEAAQPARPGFREELLRRKALRENANTQQTSKPAATVGEAAMRETSRDLRIGDRIRIVRAPGADVPGYYLHEETRLLYERLIAKRTTLRIYKIDKDNLPWVRYRCKDQEGEWEYHFLAIKDEVWELVSRGPCGPTP
jgi:uncharacterized protein (DUF433 family)